MSMERITHTVRQGSDEWQLLRQSHCTASEAPAALGVGIYVTRADLLRQKSSGGPDEPEDGVRALYQRGHDAEAAARPLAEVLVGDELFPVTVTAEIEGLRLLASMDGLTVDETIAWETKLWSEKLAEQVRSGDLAEHYTVQMDQQLAVTGASKCLFMCSDGTPERTVSCWYETSPAKRAKLIAGWQQFLADLGAYAAPTPDPVLEKRALMALPALSVQLVGKVTTSNLPAYRNSALEFIKAINTELQTDQDFADAEQTVKFCETAEKNLADVKNQAIAQTATIDELFRSIDQISDAMRQKRLMLNKLVTSRKEQIRAEIVQTGRNNWNAHINALNAALRRVSVTVLMPDFGTAIKGKRTLASLREAVDSVLTTAKIAATQQSELFTSRLAIIDEVAKDHTFLVRDLSALVAMPTETLSAVIKQRITDHQAEQDRLQAERDRIAADRAERARQQEALRTPEPPPAAPQSAPAAPVAPPAPTPVEAPRASFVAPVGRSGGTLAWRPKPEAIVKAVADAFKEPPEVALRWLRSTDFGKSQDAA